MALGDKLVNLDGLKVVSDAVGNLKSALSETKTLTITDIQPSGYTLLNSSGVIQNSGTAMKLYYCPVTKGVTYTVNHHDTSGTLVCAFFTTTPMVGSVSYNDQRIVQASNKIIAPIDGYIAFRSAGTTTDESVVSENAIDPIARQEISENTADISQNALALKGMLYSGGIGKSIADVGMLPKLLQTISNYTTQAIAVYGNTAFMMTGATESDLDVLIECDLKTGIISTHNITGVTYGTNSLAYNPEKHLLYAISHNWSPNSVVYVISVDTYELIDTVTLRNSDNSVLNAIGIDFNPVSGIIYAFYYDSSNSVINAYDTNFEFIETISFNPSTFEPTKKGTAQGFGFDGRYFLFPKSDIGTRAGNSVIYVIDKNGEFVKRIHAPHKEIEDISYDYVTGNTYVLFTDGTNGYLYRYFAETEWESIIPYISNKYAGYEAPENIDTTNTNAMIKVQNGNLYIKGDVVTTALAIGMSNVIFYLDSVVSPANGFDVNVLTDDGFKPIQLGFTNPYVAIHDVMYAPVYGSYFGQYNFSLTQAPLYFQ